MCKTEETVDRIDTKLKMEKDIIGGYEFEGIVYTDEDHTSELTTCLNSDLHNSKENHSTLINMCSKAFSNLNKSQVDKKPRPRDDHHNINICNKTFEKHNQLITHLKFNTREKTFKCDICSKIFLKKKLKDHMMAHTNTMTHTRVKSHKCDTCGKEYTRSANLIIHKRKHTGKEPYKCDVCNQKFRSTLVQ